jgi:hypothetical protein
MWFSVDLQCLLQSFALKTRISFTLYFLEEIYERKRQVHNGPSPGGCAVTINDRLFRRSPKQSFLVEHLTWFVFKFTGQSLWILSNRSRPLMAFPRLWRMGK